ncbi:MAG: septum formation family protein [Nocardioides sp.]|jgi:hypothetical protein
MAKASTSISLRGPWLAVVITLLMPLAAVIATAGPAQAGPTFQQPRVGECRAMTWDEYMGKSDNEAPIDCSQPHSSRVIDVVRLPKGVTWGAPIQKLTTIATRLCNPAWADALGRTYSSRAMTAYSVAWFMPTKAQRDRGARWIRCDLVLLAGSRLANLPTDNVPALGAQPHPARIAACLKARTFVRTICSTPHAWRATGTFTIHQKAYPTDRQFRRAAIRRCPSRTSTSTFWWQYRPKVLWRLGDHVVICYSHRSN